MSAKEYKLRKLLEDATFYIRNAEEDETFLTKCTVCMEEAESLILGNPRESLDQLSPEVIVMCVEVALLCGSREEQAGRICDIFFQRISQQDQYYCRALLSKASIEERKVDSDELKGDDNLKQVIHAFSFIKQAIEIAAKAENKQKYQFIVYNASIKTWHIIRGLMRQGWSKNLVEILERISNLLEESDDFDFNWRCRYLNILMKAMFDAEKKPEALKVLDKLVDLTKKKGPCNFMETLFRNRIHYYRDNNGSLANIKKETETGEDPLALKYLFVIQQIKSGVIPEAQIEKELQTVMMNIAPQSVSDAEDQSIQSAKIPQMNLDRLAECGRMAIKHNIINFAQGSISVCNRGNPSLRAQVWTLYSQAEVLLKKPSSDIDPKTNMKLNTLQRQFEDLARRQDALAIMERAMIANKKLADPDIIIEGCYLIWNIAIPLLKDSSRKFLYRPFISAATALENIQANENQLRVQLHLELAKYEVHQDYLSNALAQLKKCLKIDYSVTLKSLGVEITEDDDPANFQRPQDKYIKFLIKKLDLKTNLYGGGPSTVQDQIILDIENAKSSRDQKMRETILSKALRELQEFEEPEYKVDPAKDLVEEEIEAEKKAHHLNNVKERKQRVLISNEMAKLAFEEYLVDLAFQSASLAVKDQWDPIKDQDLIIAQSESHLVLSKCYVEYLLEEDIEIGHKNLVTLDDDQDEREFTNEEKATFKEQKVKFTEHVISAIKLGSQAKQTWLIFNGAVEFWNNYLPIFKLLTFYESILEEGVPAMVEAFEGMNNCFENATFSSDNVDYELAKKMNIFSNLSVMLARMNEFLGKNDETVRVCDTLLQKQLPSHLRKTFDSIRARVTKNVAAAGGGGGGKAPAKGKQDATPTNEVSKTEQIQAEVIGYLELVKNGQKDNITKALETLGGWQPDEQEEIELELNAELWCRLGRLSIEQGDNKHTKIGLFCAEQAIQSADSKAKNKDYMHIPVTRLRWYSVSECLYGESLYKLLDTKKQEKESQDKLLHESVAHFVESANIAAKAGIGYLLLENCKCMWNALLGILDAPNNRQKLIMPLSKVHSYLKEVREDSDPDFLALFYSALFMCIQEEKDWKLGERIVEEAFGYVPSTHQKVLWEAKMNFLSKLGKNVLSAISNMKESNASLMAKVYVKLARSSSQELEQHSAYNKAIEILRKEESVEVVEVLIEYAEWMQRRHYASTDIEDQLLLAVDILMDIEPGWDEDEDDRDDDGDDERKTKRSKSSKFSKGSKAQTKASRAPKSTKKTIKGPKSRISNASKRQKSMKSTGSRGSRKTKTAMSARQEEDGHPSFLNCQHFEKLVRIHSMLATTAHDAVKQREYALDAHFFVMKMWEQSYQCLNATLFFETHRSQLQTLGYSADNITDYLQEIMTNADFVIPTQHLLPEKPEDWTTFTLQEDFVAHVKKHEEKIMISKFAFAKPELTLYHLKNVCSLLADHYFSIQQLPVLQLIELFSQEVVADVILGEVACMQRSRLLMNLGLKSEADALLETMSKKYELTEEERDYNFEKIKALKDANDDMKAKDSKDINAAPKTIPFDPLDEGTPLVLTTIRIHESWLALAEEHLNWGNFLKAKELLQEVAIHARILKDQTSYAKALLHMSTVKYLEGESGTALKLDMSAHHYCQDVEMMEVAIQHTYDLLFEYNKIEDAKTLLDGSLQMLQGMKPREEPHGRKSKNFNDTKRESRASMQGTPVQNNLPLENALSTCYILKASLLIAEAAKLPSGDQEPLIRESFGFIDRFLDGQLTGMGCKQAHLEKLSVYAIALYGQVGAGLKNLTAEAVEQAKMKLEKCALILLKIQEQLTDQLYYIGIHGDSGQTQKISLPLARMLGVVKLRLAQINTEIGVIKNSIKQTTQSLKPQGASSEEKDSGAISIKENYSEQQKAEYQKEMQRLNKELVTFMDQVTKQIEAQANTYNKEMNRYEKSITMLQSALNLIHKDCKEHAECLVEIARCQRLLAVNKKHLRGQWRQDAQSVDDVNLNRSVISDHGHTHDRKDRHEVLAEKELDGEVLDKFVDYKEETLKAFVRILDQNKPAPVEGEDEKPQNSPEFQQLIDYIGRDRAENVLATFSMEQTETRGNLNKEQAFFYLALYQYALSRQSLQDLYLKATTEKHPDVQRLRQCSKTEKLFSQFTCPHLPSSVDECRKAMLSQSKPTQTLHQFYNLEEMKEHLPGSGGYLILQLSDDEQYLFCGFMTISKDRQVAYFMTKMHLGNENRDKLLTLVKNLAQAKMTMQKAPITIEEDLNNLEKDSNAEIVKLVDQLEAFFDPITHQLNDIINPNLSMAEDSQDTGSKAKAAEKKEDKKKDAGKAPAKGAKTDAALAAYESPLPLPTSGLESIVLFIDDRIESLPLESLSVFSKVPVVARDFNVHMYMSRLKWLGHQADLHNNKGISKESLSFIVDPPQTMEEKGEQFTKNDLNKLMPGAVWNGTFTPKEHQPSPGEWQEKISSSQLFAYFSMTCLLHKFHPALIADLSIFSQCKAMIIFDRMNSYKTLVDRSVVTSRHFVPSDQPRQEAALFSLCGVSTVITNHWSIKPENSLELMEKLLQGSMTEGIYLGAAVKQYWDKAEHDVGDLEDDHEDKKNFLEKSKALYRSNNVLYGVPLVRVV